MAEYPYQTKAGQDMQFREGNSFPSAPPIGFQDSGAPPYPPSYNQTMNQPPYAPDQCEQTFSFSPPPSLVAESVAGNAPYRAPGTHYSQVNVSVPSPEHSVIVVPQRPPRDIAPGMCPTCRVGHLHTTYPCCAICLAIFCFPIGLICCLCMNEKKCDNCGYHS